VLFRPILNSATHRLTVVFDGEESPNVESSSFLISVAVKPYSAYETLLVKYKEMYPDATKDVKKKINSLRTNYRKELKKHHQSLKSGTGADDVPI
jgi:hypothetical protein